MHDAIPELTAAMDDGPMPAALALACCLSDVVGQLDDAQRASLRFVLTELADRLRPPVKPVLGWDSAEVAAERKANITRLIEWKRAQKP